MLGKGGRIDESSSSHNECFLRRFLGRTLMRLTQEDRAAITELISLHGHLVDSGELDRLHELFTDDIT